MFYLIFKIIKISFHYITKGNFLKCAKLDGKKLEKFRCILSMVFVARSNRFVNDLQTGYLNLNFFIQIPLLPSRLTKLYKSKVIRFKSNGIKYTFSSLFFLNNKLTKIRSSRMKRQAIAHLKKNNFHTWHTTSFMENRTQQHSITSSDFLFV